MPHSHVPSCLRAQSISERFSPLNQVVLWRCDWLRACLLALLLVTAGTGSFAQETNPPSKQPDNKPAEGSPKSDTWDRLIYLPYKNLAAVFERENATVFMPYAQFQKLWRNAHPLPPANPNQPPVSAVIAKADYSGVVENNLARVEAKYVIKVLDKPWARIPLKFGDAAVGKLTATNDQILIIGTGEGSYELLLPTVGEHTVTLELLTRVHTATDGRSFELEVPVVGISNLNLTLPAPDQTIEVLPHLATGIPEGDANTTKVQASLGATNQFTAKWYPRVSKTPEMELLTTVNNQTHVRIADGLVQNEAILTYQVLRGEFHQAQISIPLGQRIIDVTAPNLKGYKVAQEANRQVLTVDLLAGTNKTVPIEVRTERAVTEEVMELGGVANDGPTRGIHALGAVRESGLLVASHGPELALTVAKQQGLIRVEATDAPESLRRPDNLYFKFFNPTFQLGVSARPVEPLVNATHHTVLRIQEDELRLEALLKYSVERAGLFELRYNLPDGLKIDVVECTNRQEHSVSADGKTLVITLNQKTQGEIQCTIRGHISFEAKVPESMTLPLLEPLNLSREDGQLQVYAPKALEIITDEKGVVSAQPDRADSHPGALGVLNLNSAWTFNRRPVTIPVKVVRKPTRLTADIATTADVKRELVEVSTRVTYHIEYAGVDQFRIAVPAAVANSVQIDPVLSESSVGIKQKTKGEPVDGWVTWTIVTQREALNQQVFRVKFDLPLKRDKATATILVQPVRVLGLLTADGKAESTPITNITGEMLVQKDRIWSLAAVPKNMEAIDVRELTLLPQEGALAYRYSRQPVEVELQATEHEIQEVVQTVVSRALIEAVISHDNQVTYRCQYQLKTSERQRLLLELPAKVQSLGVVVAGKQVNLERNTEARPTNGMEAYFVNVARPGRADESFTLSLLYRIPGVGLPHSGFGGRLEVFLPLLGGAAAQAQVAIQQMRVVVWVPEKISLIGNSTDFELENQLSLEAAMAGRSAGVKNSQWNGWISDSTANLFEFPTAGHAFVYRKLGDAISLRVSWWRTSWLNWLWTVVLLLVGWVLRRTTWENKLGLVLFCGCIAAAWAVSSHDQMFYFLSTARYGLFGLAGLWVISGLLPATIPVVKPSPTGIPAVKEAPLVVAPEVTPPAAREEPPANHSNDPPPAG